MNILSELKERFRAALDCLGDEVSSDRDELLAMIRPSQSPQFGDYQANLAMPLGKKLGKPPREIASLLIEALDVADFCLPCDVAGPGFINLRLREDWLTRQLELARRDERLGCRPTAAPGRFVVDFSSPNVAKPLHVGHIRSTVLGDTLCRTLRFKGHQVISDNHLGDWGTQFGMIIFGYRHFVDAAAYQKDPVQELGRLYRVVRRLMDYEEGLTGLPQREAAIARQRQELAELTAAPPATEPKAEKKRKKVLQKAKLDLQAAEQQLVDLRSSLAQAETDATIGPLLKDHSKITSAVLEETAKLHQGDAYNRQLWEEFLPKCREAIHAIYRRLNVTFDEELGESFYHDRLADVVSSLRKTGLATDSEGAVCVFLDHFETPLIIQKKDGAFLYATTDLATIAYRREKWQPTSVLYVVDFRQSEHFEKLFALAAKWGYDDVDFRHIKFGAVLGEDGRPYKTRAGDTVGLAGLLDEAEARAYEVVAANDDAKAGGWELDETARRHVAQVVGLAAIKYADLSQNRESDYVFSYDKMLALQGNTATYMQYSYARAHGIFAKGQVDIAELRASAAKLNLSHPAERALGLKLLQFDEALDDVLVDYRPNQLTSYLFELAKGFSAFFENCPVVKAEQESERLSRYLLCDLTARTVKLGLALLGIDVVEKM